VKAPKDGTGVSWKEEYIYLFLDKVRMNYVVNELTKLRVPCKALKLLKSWAAFSSSKKTFYAITSQVRDQ